MHGRTFKNINKINSKFSHRSIYKMQNSNKNIASKSEGDGRHEL